jgi:hypothetical protein
MKIFLLFFSLFSCNIIFSTDARPYPKIIPLSEIFRGKEFDDIKKNIQILVRKHEKKELLNKKEEKKFIIDYLEFQKKELIFFDWYINFFKNKIVKNKEKTKLNMVNFCINALKKNNDKKNNYEILIKKINDEDELTEKLDISLYYTKKISINESSYIEGHISVFDNFKKDDENKKVLLLDMWIDLLNQQVMQSFYKKNNESFNFFLDKFFNHIEKNFFVKKEIIFHNIFHKMNDFVILYEGFLNNEPYKDTSVINACTQAKNILYKNYIQESSILNIFSKYYTYFFQEYYLFDKKDDELLKKFNVFLKDGLYQSYFYNSHSTFDAHKLEFPDQTFQYFLLKYSYIIDLHNMIHVFFPKNSPPSSSLWDKIIKTEDIKDPLDKTDIHYDSFKKSINHFFELYNDNYIYSLDKIFKNEKSENLIEPFPFCQKQDHKYDSLVSNMIDEIKNFSEEKSQSQKIKKNKKQEKDERSIDDLMKNIENISEEKNKKKPNDNNKNNKNKKKKKNKNKKIKEIVNPQQTCTTNSTTLSLNNHNSDGCDDGTQPKKQPKNSLKKTSLISSQTPISLHAEKTFHDLEKIFLEHNKKYQSIKHDNLLKKKNHKNSLNLYSTHLKDVIKNLAHQYLLKHEKKASIIILGSLVSNLSSPHSDVELVIMTDGNPDDDVLNDTKTFMKELKSRGFLLDKENIYPPFDETKGSPFCLYSALGMARYAYFFNYWLEVQNKSGKNKNRLKLYQEHLDKVFSESMNTPHSYSQKLYDLANSHKPYHTGRYTSDPVSQLISNLARITPKGLALWGNKEIFDTYKTAYTNILNTHAIELPWDVSVYYSFEFEKFFNKSILKICNTEKNALKDYKKNQTFFKNVLNSYQKNTLVSKLVYRIYQMGTHIQSERGNHKELNRILPLILPLVRESRVASVVSPDATFHELKAYDSQSVDYILTILDQITLHDERKAHKNNPLQKLTK